MITSVLIKSRNFIKPPALKVFERRSRVDLQTVHTSTKEIFSHASAGRLSHDSYSNRDVLAFS